MWGVMLLVVQQHILKMFTCMVSMAVAFHLLVLDYLKNVERDDLQLVQQVRSLIFTSV